jgi:competence protein ComEC
VALVAGLGTIVCGWLPPVAILLGYVCAICLQGLQKVVQWAQGVEFGHLYVPGPPWWWLLLSYVGLAWLTLKSNWLPDLRRSVRRTVSGQSVPAQADPNQAVEVHRGLLAWPAVRRIALVVCWLGCGAWLATTRVADHDSMECTFLAMGHGTCVVLELPGGQTVLYDMGSMGSPEGASRRVAAYLWSRGITYIDAIVLSHADVDHYNGIPGLLERFSVGCIYVSPHMFEQPFGNAQGLELRQLIDADNAVEQLSAPEYLRSMIAAQEVSLQVVARSDRLPASDSRTQMEVLHPHRQRQAGRDNSNSILLAIEYEGWRILLPGDLESPGLETVLAGTPYDCDVLLAPHHGSVHSNPSGFANWCNPQWVVVSGQHPGKETSMAYSYRQQGAKVVYTSTQGAVHFTLTREGVGGITCFRTAFQEYFSRAER